MSADHDLSNVVQIVWPRALGPIDALSDQLVEMIVRDDDLPLIDAVTRAEFEATDEAGVTTWMPAAERPEVRPLADGFELAARSDIPTRPHHMIRRSGEQVAERLGECSLYRPEFDLAVYAPNGEASRLRLVLGRSNSQGWPSRTDAYRSPVPANGSRPSRAHRRFGAPGNTWVLVVQGELHRRERGFATPLLGRGLPPSLSHPHVQTPSRPAGRARKDGGQGSPVRAGGRMIDAGL
jgi:hypothetical protein